MVTSYDIPCPSSLSFHPLFWLCVNLRRGEKKDYRMDWGYAVKSGEGGCVAAHGGAMVWHHTGSPQGATATTILSFTNGSDYWECFF
jgi:hypothetical protein